MMRVKLYVFSSLGLLGVVLGTSGACFDNDSCLEDGSCFAGNAPEPGIDASPGPEKDAGVGSDSDPAKVEICFNGLDDDGDNKFDCADEDCNLTSTCFDAIPLGWTGYHWIRFVSDVDGPAELCENGTTPNHYFVDPPDKHECALCQTALLDAASSCQWPDLECWEGTECGTGKQLQPLSSIETCTTWKGTDNKPAHCRITGEPTPPGCASTTDVPKQKPTWAHRLDICNAPVLPTGGGCSQGMICIPRSANAMNGEQCIFASGHEYDKCPTGWETMRKAYTTASDSRDCTMCGCSTWCEWDGYTITGDPGCYDYPDTMDDTIKVPLNTCKGITKKLANFQFGMKTTKTPIPRHVATGGEPTGAFVPNGPVTFCCKPGAN